MSAITEKMAFEVCARLLKMAREEKGAVDPNLADTTDPSMICIMDMDSGKTWMVKLEEF